MLPPESGLPPQILGGLGWGSSGAAAASGPTDTQQSRQGPPSSLPAPRLYPPGACPAFAFFSGKSTLASAPRWPLSRSGQPGKWRGRRHQAPGRTAAVQPAAPVAAANPPTPPPEPGAPACSRFSLAAGGRRLRGCVPRAKGPPRGLGVPSPHRGPTHLRGRRNSTLCRGHRNWDRAPGAWPSRSAPPAWPPS